MAIRPKKSIKQVALASDPNGSRLVDHGDHVAAKPHEDVAEGAELFHKFHLRDVNPDTVEEGVTAKAFVKAFPAPNKSNKARKAKTFMVKPYWEDLSDWEASYYPLGGWSEMATHGLMHAANLGHMAMKVHAFEYPMGKNDGLMDTKYKDYVGVDPPKRFFDKVPMLAVELEKGLKTIREERGDSGSGGDTFSHLHGDAAKLAVIDFLTNHQDRHAGNLLVENDEDGKPVRMLAIDNGRSFQYRMANRFVHETHHKENFLDYTDVPALRFMKVRKNPQALQEVAQWWPKVRNAVVREFANHLANIKDPGAQAHIASHFMDRIKNMDNFAVDFPKYGIKPYLSEVSNARLARISHKIKAHKPHKRYTYF